MSLFSWNTFLYLSLHALGFLLCLASALGIPGQVEETNPKLQKISKYFGFFLSLAWTGIPIAFIGSVLAFIFEWRLLWKLFPIASFVLGFSAFICLVRLYRVK